MTPRAIAPVFISTTRFVFAIVRTVSVICSLYQASVSSKKWRIPLRFRGKSGWARILNLPVDIIFRCVSKYSHIQAFPSPLNTLSIPF